MTTAIKIKPQGSPEKDEKSFKYELWSEIRRKYPDRWVLLENPVRKPRSTELLKGVFIYKNKSKRKVVEKASEYNFDLATIEYTGGPLSDNDCIFIF